MSLVDRLAEAARQLEALAYDSRHVTHDAWMATVYDRHVKTVHEAMASIVGRDGPRPRVREVHAGDSTHEPTDPPAA